MSDSSIDMVVSLLLTECEPPVDTRPDEISASLHKVGITFLQDAGGAKVLDNAVSVLRGVVGTWDEDARPAEEELVKEASWVVRQTINGNNQPGEQPASKPVDHHYVTRLTHEQLHPTPMIGAWVDWMLQGAYVPQPELSLLAVLTSCGAIIGRNYQHRGVFANQYAFALAPTGCGKERLQTGCEEVIKAARFGPILGGSDVVSEAGIFAELAVSNQRLWISDEVHGMLARVAVPNPAPHHISVITTLLKGYSGKELRGRFLKAGATPTIAAPNMSLLGFSQPKSLWPYASASFANNGFLGRFIVFAGDPRAKFNDKADRANKLPSTEFVIEPLTQFYNAHQPTVLSQVGLGSGPAIREIGTSDEVDALELSIRDEIQAQREERLDDDVYQEVCVRMFEHIRKLVLIHAWSINPISPVATKDGVMWAYGILKASRDCMMQGITGAKIQSSSDSIITNMEKFIKSHSPVPYSIFYDKFRGINKYTDILSDLIQNGIVSKSNQPNPKGRGRSVTILTYIKEQSDA